MCDGLEYIWTNGGDVLDPSDLNKVVIDSPEAAAGSAVEQSLVEDGVAPQSVATYTETETDPAFLGNKAVFARNWPYMYSLGRHRQIIPDVKPEQIGVAPLPAGEPDTSSSARSAGGTCSSTPRPICRTRRGSSSQWMTASSTEAAGNLRPRSCRPARRCMRTRRSGRRYRSSWKARRRSRTPRSRPDSPYYSDMSLEMQEQFNGVVKGDTSPEDAVASLQDEPGADHRGGGIASGNPPRRSTRRGLQIER